mgnify:CR=1 FL=1|tara:strand:+ start:1917 stop:3410 length:1494 start_codon:yes stop_codon:yes gene_type:complete
MKIIFKDDLSNNKFKLNFLFNKILLILILVSVIIKIPDINILLRGDIETYLVIADAYLKGNFNTFYDNKSQFTYSLYALLLYLSSYDLRIFQIFGIVIIFFTALLVSKNGDNSKHALWMGIIYLFFSTLFNDGGDYILTEHLALVPILVSFLILNKTKTFNKDLLIAGIMLTISSLIRQNFIILHIFVFLFLIVKIKQFGSRRVISFIIGSTLTWLLFFIIIYSIDGIEFFFKNFFFQAENLSTVDFFFNFYRLSLFGLYIHNFDLYNYENIKIFNALNFYLISFIILILNLRKLIRENILLIIYIFSISLGIFLTGSYSTHYLIQIMPFLTILIVKFSPKKKSLFLLFRINIIFLIVVLLFDYNIYFKKETRGSYKDHIQLVNWLRENLDPDDKVYLYRGHSAYIQIPQNSLSNYAHPPNILKKNFLRYINDDSTYTPNKEWQNILKINPKFIVMYKSDDFENFLKNVEDNNFNNSTVNNNKKITHLGVFKIIVIN